jgi:hypothetical protein
LHSVPASIERTACADTTFSLKPQYVLGLAHDKLVRSSVTVISVRVQFGVARRQCAPSSSPMKKVGTHAVSSP